MMRKTFVASAVAGLLTLATAATASATSAQPTAQPPAPEWIAVFDFGAHAHCLQAGATGQQLGALPADGWTCDSGWLMVRPPAES